MYMVFSYKFSLKEFTQKTMEHWRVKLIWHQRAMPCNTDFIFINLRKKRISESDLKSMSDITQL